MSSIAQTPLQFFREEEFLPLTRVCLMGQLTVGGMSTRDLQVLRDQCELALHRSGMVRLKRFNEQFYILPGAVQHVEVLTEPDSAKAVKMEPEEVPDPVHADDMHPRIDRQARAEALRAALHPGKTAK